MNVEVLKSIPVVGKKVRNNRTREALQALQRSATDPDLFVSSPKLMSKTEKKIEKSSELAFNIIKGDSSSKENAPVRRSKRKTPSTRKQPDKKISYENIENVSTTVPKVASKSKKVPSKKKIKTDLKNSKTDSLIPSLPDVFGTPTENKEMETTVLPYRSVSEIENMLTADIPPESYWKELAEQRRISLEQTLRENADLADQLEVLEAENSHLKSCLKEAEKLAETLNAILD